MTHPAPSPRWARALVLTGIPCGLVVLGLWLADSGSSSSRAGISVSKADAPAGPSQTEKIAAPGRSPVSSLALPRDSELRSVAEILETYWGPEYESIREAAQEAGVDLDRLTEPPPPWESIQEEAREHFKLSEASRASLRRLYLGETEAYEEASWFVDTLGLDGALLDDIAVGELFELRAVHDAEIEPVLQTYLTQLDATIRELWATQQFRKAPLFLPKGERYPMIKASSFSTHGWSVSFLVRSDQNPHLAELSEELVLLGLRRDQELRRHVRDH